MSSTSAFSRASQAILWAGLICGVLDGLSAVAITLLFGGKVIRTFQGIAGGILGAKTFQNGISSALLGVALHFLIAFGAAAVYYLASRYMPFLIDRALPAGILYGIAVHLFMQFVVIPLSAIGPRPLVMRNFVAVLIAHVVVVGPSIALTVRRYSR
jgi:uncharacterized membrane protein YagU involved in acid resistance